MQYFEAPEPIDARLPSVFLAARWQDVDIQMELARPGLRVRHHLSDALDEVALELDRLR